MYDHLHKYILELITAMYTKHVDCSSMNDFTHYYVAHFHSMIFQNRFDDEYIRKLSTYDVLWRLTKLAEDCGCVDTLSYDVLFNFMTRVN